MAGSARLLQLPPTIFSLAAARAVTPNCLLEIHLSLANPFLTIVLGKGGNTAH